MDEMGIVLLFSYGTLQDEAVQHACFGRLLDGEADSLSGYARSWIEIFEAAAADERRGVSYPVLDPTGNAADEVRGRVFEITDADLASADAYEGAEYRRVRVRLGSGADAWVYIRA